jgi:hypothetical protein
MICCFHFQANDVVQNSKKKYPEFANEFAPVMKKVLENLAQAKLDDKTIKSIARYFILTMFKPKVL